jgi:hypothetical protein
MRLERSKSSSSVGQEASSQKAAGLAVAGNAREDRDLKIIDIHARLALRISTRQPSSPIVNGHPNSRIDDLLPWAYRAEPELKAVA